MASLQDTVMQTAAVINAAVTGTSAQSAAISGDKPFVVARVAVTEGTYIEYGSNPTASATTSEYWPAGQVEYIKMNSGDKVAFIRSTSDGRITISRKV